MFCCKVCRQAFTKLTFQETPPTTTGGLSSTSGSRTDNDSDDSDSSSGTSGQEDGDLAQRYPVQVAPRLDVLAAVPPRGKGSRRRVPGDKKRMRKEKIRAKRAARGGLEVQQVNERLRAMVVEDVDMEVRYAVVDITHTCIYIRGLMRAAMRHTWWCAWLGAMACGQRCRARASARRWWYVVACCRRFYTSTYPQVQQTAHSALPHGGQVELLQEIMTTEMQRQGGGNETPAPKPPQKHARGATPGPPIAFVASGLLLEDGTVHSTAEETTSAVSPAEFLARQRLPTNSEGVSPRAIKVGSSNAGRLLGLGLALGLGPDVFKAEEPPPSSLPSPPAPQEFGAFEQHTRGFGSRMLSKMGFVEGQGLGRHRDGIASPLASTQRPKRLGLGAGE